MGPVTAVAPERPAPPEPRIRCARCGYLFPAVAGKYGCPNCHGEGLGPTGRDVARLLGRSWGTWGEFKRRLVEAGVLASYYDDAPPAWLEAWRKFCRRGRS